MGCYLKSIYEEDQEFLPGTTTTLIDTESVEYAQQVVSQKRRPNK